MPRIGHVVQRWRLQKEAIESVDTGLGRILKWGEVLYEYAQNNPQSMRLQRYWDHRGVKWDHVSTEVFARFKAINDELAEGLRRISRTRDSGSDVLSAMKHSLLQGIMPQECLLSQTLTLSPLG